MWQSSDRFLDAHFFETRCFSHHSVVKTRRQGNPTTRPMLDMLISTKFGVSVRGAPMGLGCQLGHWWCQTGRGVSEFLQVLYTKPVDIYYNFAAVSIEFNFLTTAFWGTGARRESTMVLLGRAMVSFHRLSVQTTVVSGTVWLQFAMQVWTVSCEPPAWGKGGRDGFPEYSPVTTSYSNNRPISHSFLVCVQEVTVGTGR